MEKLWYASPAEDWFSSLPLGNGKLGVMVLGGKKRESLYFNDGTLWSGYPKDQTNPDSAKNLAAVRDLVFSGNYHKAEMLARETFLGGYSEAYLPVGNVYIDFSEKKYEDYKRELCLKTAVHTVSYKGGKRTSFVSYPDNAAFYLIETDEPSSMTFTAESELNSGLCVDNGIFFLGGNAPDATTPNYVNVSGDGLEYTDGLGMAFCLAFRVSTNGKTEYYNDKITIKDATKTLLVAVSETGFSGYDKMPDTNLDHCVDRCRDRLKKLTAGYDEILKRHVDDYQALYGKHIFSLNVLSNDPTDKLVERAKKGSASKALIELYYNFGKYLTIASSRKGGQTSTLQGLWNREVRPPWSCNYTVNINTEMNYWGASQVNLSECIEPLVDMVSEITVTGKKTAEVNYKCEGSCCNHNVDLWRKTTPAMGHCCYMHAPLCGAWLTNEVYGHYKNGGLDRFKEDIFEAVKQQALFALDYLVEHDGTLVTCPSTSPEANFISKGKISSLGYGSAYELGVIRQLFINFLELSDDEGLKTKVGWALDNLQPFKSGKNGILEWNESFKPLEKGHRHFSPLYAFYPGNVVKYYENPAETEEIRKLYLYRINHSRQHIGWNAAWAICLAGRLHDKDAALKIINKMMGTSIFKNLFDFHPPRYFQIDGNFGFIAGVNELLVYNENDVTELLPALPDGWNCGKMYGYIHHGKNLSFEWKDGKIIKFYCDKPITLRNVNISEACVLPSYVTLI